MTHLAPRKVSSQEVARVAQAAGFRQPELQVAVAIAMAESGASPIGSDGGNANAHALTRREDSRGLWQINVMAHPQFAGTNLYDPATNARAAFSVKQSQGWMAWSVFRPDKGAKYLLYMPKAGAAVQSIPGDQPIGDPTTDAAAAKIQEAKDIVPDVAGAIKQASSLVAKAGTWVSDPSNILRVVYVALGAALVIGALVMFAAPIAEPAVKVAGKAADIAL